MTSSQPGKDSSRSDLVRALTLTRWVVPLLMSLIGVSYTALEHFRHVNDPGWPWITVLGFVVLGVFGPMLSWMSLRWAVDAARAHEQAQQRLARRNEELATINSLGLAASEPLNLETRITTVLEQIMDVLDAEAGMLFLQEDSTPGLRLESHRGIPVEMARQEARLSPGHCLCGRAVESRQVLFADDVEGDRRCTSDLCICAGFHAVICAPLEARGQLVGLLQLASPHPGHFHADQIDFLSAAARQVSVSIENARLYDTVRGLNVSLEQKVNERTRQLEQAQWSLTEKARQLQGLLSETYRVQEDTQARIAHDMHDTVTQLIVGALYETQAARDLSPADPDRVAENLAQAQTLLMEAETEIRRVIYDLHPPVLDMMGLVIALKRFAATYQTTFGIQCEIQVAGQARRLAHTVEIAIYRLLQAALHNVASHAQASQVEVRFDFGSALLKVAVEDNGIGFDPAKVLAAPGEHLGLVGMKERANSIGADLVIDAAPGRGTCIQLRLEKPEYAAEGGENPAR